MFKHILVPTDGSELSKKPLVGQFRSPRRPGLALRRFLPNRSTRSATMVKGALIDPTTPEKFAELAEQQAQQTLDFVAQLCQDAGVQVESCR
jgi:nucleotide-binding universal stress UspA family protein